MIIKRVSDTTDQLAKMAGNVNDFFSEAKTKLRNATSYAPLVIEGVRNLTEYIKNKQRESSDTKTKSKTKD